VEWKLVDAVHPPSQWEEAINQRAAELAPKPREMKGIALEPLTKAREANEIRYRFLTLKIDPQTRVAWLTFRTPEKAEPLPAEPSQAGAGWYPLALFRELDDALVELRLNFEEVALVVLKSEGDPDVVEAYDRELESHGDDWFVREARLLIRRTLKRMETTARSLFTLVEPGSCFGGFLYELALASDRTYMMDDAENAPTIRLSPLNSGAFPMGNGLTRLAQRFIDDPAHLESLNAGSRPSFNPEEAMEAGLITASPDDLDWEDEIRIAIEERASMSPDALTGMEASLRFAGPETMETKIFSRLSAWQNWIFQRPNATGERGALTLYGQPESPVFDRRRT